MASRRIALLALAAGLAAAAGAVAMRARRRGGGGAAETHTCRCGTVYRVSGTDRHRVYWLLDAAEGDPVLGTTCVECDAPLPAGHASATA
jgi:hypothetical protein